MPIDMGPSKSESYSCTHVVGGPADAEAAFKQLDQKVNEGQPVFQGNLKIEQTDAWDGDSVIVVNARSNSNDGFQSALRFSKKSHWVGSDEYQMEFYQPSIESWYAWEVYNDTMVPYLPQFVFSPYVELFGLETKTTQCSGGIIR